MESILYAAAKEYSQYEPDLSTIVPPLVYVDPDDSKQVITYKTALNDYVDSMIVDFITNGNIEERWDDYIAQLEGLGLNELIALNQAAYEQ